MEAEPSLAPQWIRRGPSSTSYSGLGQGAKGDQTDQASRLWASNADPPLRPGGGSSAGYRPAISSRRSEYAPTRPFAGQTGGSPDRAWRNSSTSSYSPGAVPVTSRVNGLRDAGTLRDANTKYTVEDVKTGPGITRPRSYSSASKPVDNGTRVPPPQDFGTLGATDSSRDSRLDAYSGRGAPAPAQSINSGPRSAINPTGHAYDESSGTYSNTAAGQAAVYQKVVFEKEFPTLSDSKHPLGYAPKEAPYKQTFLASRITTNWTSKLAEVPVQSEQPEADSTTVQQKSVSTQLVSQNASATAAASGSSQSLWNAVASANVAAPSASFAAAPSHSYTHGSHGKLREQLAVKHSKQLVPVLAKKEDSSSAGMLSLGKAKSIPANGKGLHAAVGYAAKAAGHAPEGKLLVSGGAVIVNGTITLTKKMSAPLDKPLPVPRVASTSQAIAAPSATPASDSTAACSSTGSQDSSASLTASTSDSSDMGARNSTSGAAPDSTEHWQESEAAGALMPGPQQKPPEEQLQTAAIDASSACADAAGMATADQAEVPGRHCRSPSCVAAETCSPASASAPALQAQLLQQDDDVLPDPEELTCYLPDGLLGPSSEGEPGLPAAVAELQPDPAAQSEQQTRPIDSPQPHAFGGRWPLQQQGPGAVHLPAQQQGDAGAAGAVDAEQAAAAAKFQVSAEEEAFLRSLGWTDADDDTDDVLTEEEIAAFKATAQARTTGSNGGMSSSMAAHGAQHKAALTSMNRHAGGMYTYASGMMHGHMAGGVMYAVPPVMQRAHMNGHAHALGAASVAAALKSRPMMVPGFVPAIPPAKMLALSYGSELSTTDSEDL